MANTRWSTAVVVCSVVCTLAGCASTGTETVCGPQSPRDLSVAGGTNHIRVPGDGTLPPRLCNVHFHRPAEHAGIAACPAVAAGSAETEGVCGGGGAEPVRPGDVVEVHWVYTSCPPYPEPLPGLENCACDAPPELVLMAIGQVYVVDDGDGGGGAGGELPPPPLDGLTRYGGSTTGPKYSGGGPNDPRGCSPLRVQWAMSRQCLPLALSTLGAWCESNEWGEDHADDIRPVIRRESWLSPYVPDGD